ncbi:hypothetical protein Rhe02_19940 [Rhizocola hellebori]|uniref:F5/8 type C domain-containing protein n=1 Tax=Rhizocola hellebori TaxID=1392758 RepID=A0A8J3VF98_9ACTN|nr:LamG-like jellyroll fold domain-containing protein [Rhizocola hellebori]GIH03927.1 hypothetical protein Rhe02_19940 [Rhizocola hellebori]
MNIRLAPVLLALALVPAAFVSPPGTAHAAPSMPCEPTAASTPAALAHARRCLGRVEALDRRTETSQVFVHPDGSGTMETYAYPQRVKLRDGQWSSLDATLQRRADGSISPRASVVDSTFSGGGAAPLVVGKRGGNEVSLSWPSALPAPELSGNTATYPNVLPGVDLVVTATETGFGEVLVVRDRAAARNPALRKLSLGTQLKGLHWTEHDGALAAVDAQGRAMLVADAPRMWDSAAEPGERSTAAKPSKQAKTAPIAVSRSGDHLTLTPDVSLLDNPSAVFPLFLDPTISTPTWTMINSQFTTQSYWSYDKQDCPPEPGKGGAVYQTDCAKVGQAVGYTMDYRSMWQFSTADFVGLQITSTKFTIDLLHSSLCNNGTAWTQLRWVNAGLGSGTTWANNSGSWDSIDAGSSNADTCNQARKGTEFAGSRLQEIIEIAARDSWASVTWGLKGESETDSGDWKKFDAKTARLIVGVNHVPGVPTSLTTDNQACVTGSNRPFVKTATPALSAYLSDYEGQKLTASYEWARIRNDGSYGSFGAFTKTLVDPGHSEPINATAGVIEGGDEIVGAADWTRDGKTDVLVRDTGGVLYVLPGDRTVLKPRQQIATGMGGFTFAGWVDWDKDGYLDAVGRIDTTGELRLYVGGPSGWTGSYYVIGGGWGGYTFFGLADWDRDGHQDILARDPNGDEWLYPGESKRTVSGQARALIGAGWGGYTSFGTIDWDKDGSPDVIARDPSTGQLWLYLGSGTRSYYSGSPYRYEIGAGWAEYTAKVMPDFNGDGNADLIAQYLSERTWYSYPGSGARTSGGARSTIATLGLSDAVRYVWTARSHDGYAWSGTSALCEFEVDTTKPAVPTVIPDIYVEGQTRGSVGKTGRFTFSSSSDTKTFKWGWSDPPGNTLTPGTLGGSVSIDWTPQSGGLKTLYVKAIDRAGNEESKIFQFFVAAPTNAIARWRMNDVPADPPTPTVFVDDTGNGRTATVAGATLQQPGRIVGGQPSAGFDGDDNAATASSAIADTSKSFSVAAWVKLGDLATSHTVISQGGTSTSAFLLEYERAGQWKFTATSADSSTPGYAAAIARTLPRKDVWTHLVGQYDSAARELRIYVNGVLERAEPNVVMWDANGPTLLGGSSPQRWVGNLAEVQAWDRAITSDEVRALVNPDDAAWGSKVGLWHFDAGYDPSADSSAYGHDLNYQNGVTIPLGQSGQTGTGVQLDGVDDSMVTDGQVLHTDQSFTVSAWAKIANGADMTGNHQVLGQDGQLFSGFYLGYRNVSGTPRWSFAMKETDEVTAAWAAASSPTPLTVADQGVWTKLTASYNASTGAMTLHVNDALVATATRALAGWDATGSLSVGRAWWTSAAPGDFAHEVDHWAGNIDEVVAYQGLFVPNIALNRTATADSTCNADESAAKAVDGRWASSVDKWCSLGASKWLRIDLGTARPFRAITIRHAEQGGESTDSNTRDFTIEVSDDGAVWTTVATVTGNTRGLTDHPFATVTKRYVRLAVQTPAQSGNPAARIYEVEVY